MQEYAEIKLWYHQAVWLHISDLPSSYALQLQEAVMDQAGN